MLTAVLLSVLFVPVFFVVVRRFFKPSERQLRMYRHESENLNLHVPTEDR
jgi:multidrug efflux pump